MRVRWLVLGNWMFGWKTASKNSTASRGKVLFREHLACLNLATLTRFGSWIYPHLALLKRFCSLLGSHFQIWRTLWDRGEKALCTWPLQSKREQNISTGPGLPRLRGQSQLGNAGIVQPAICNLRRESVTCGKETSSISNTPWEPQRCSSMDWHFTEGENHCSSLSQLQQPPTHRTYTALQDRPKLKKSAFLY